MPSGPGLERGVASQRRGEGVGHGNELEVALGTVPQRVEPSARSAPAATDERELDLVDAGGVSHVAQFERSDGRHRGRSLHEIAARNRDVEGCLLRGVLCGKSNWKASSGGHWNLTIG